MIIRVTQPIYRVKYDHWVRMTLDLCCRLKPFRTCCERSFDKGGEQKPTYSRQSYVAAAAAMLSPQQLAQQRLVA